MKNLGRLLWNWLETYFNSVAAIDLRSLGLFRIAVGLIAAWDLALQLPHLTAFYSDDGFFPRTAFDAWVKFHWMANIFELTGSSSIICIIFLVGIAAGLALALGWKARWMALLCWFVIIQTHNRNYFLLQGGDVILRCCLLYLVFLPSAARFNFLHRVAATNSDRVLSGASFLLVSQIAVVYLFAGLHKNSLDWTLHYEAAYNALQIDNYASAFGIWLTNFPTLLHTLTKYVVWTEILCGILIFIPFTLCRYLAIAIILGLQIGFFFSFNLGTFPLIGSAVAFALLPSHFWNLRWVSSLQEKFQMRRPCLRVLPHPRIGLPIVLNIFLVFTAICIWIMNFDNLHDTQRLNTYVRFGMKLVRLDQGWSLFAPNPTKYDGWFVMPGKLVNGSVVDAYRGGELSWEKPPVVSELYPNHKWRKFMISLSAEEHKVFLSTFSYYLCSQWNKTHPTNERLLEFEMHWMDEPVVYRGQKTLVKKRPLATRKCQITSDS